MRAEEEQNTPAEKSCAYGWTPHELKYLSQVIATETPPRRAQPKQSGRRAAKSADPSVMTETRREETAALHAPDSRMA
jgi:hypothetical protein